MTVALVCAREAEERNNGRSYYLNLAEVSARQASLHFNGILNNKKNGRYGLTLLTDKFLSFLCSSLTFSVSDEN